MEKLPKNLQLLFLPFKAVRLLVYEEKNDIPIIATGFIILENEQAFLYTAWHVVTGFKNPYVLEVPHNPPARRHTLVIQLQKADKRSPGITAIGGVQNIDIKLYENELPIWIQDLQEIPNGDINSRGIKVPFWHDAIKIPLKNRELFSEEITLNKNDFLNMEMLSLTEKVLIVGYPYGYSALGEKQPTPVVLTRYIAATEVLDRNRVFLVDGAGSESMSGSPVFLWRNDNLKLVGLYAGLLYPGKKEDKHAALGTCVNLTWAFNKMLPAWSDLQ